MDGSAIAAIAIFGFSFARPHVDPFAVPALGVAGAALRIPYQTGDVGTPTYALEDERVAPLIALPAPAPPQEQLIDAIGIDTSQVHDGGTITLRYRTRATNGRIEVRGAQNRLWASVPIARNGISKIVLPRFGKDKELRVGSRIGPRT